MAEFADKVVIVTGAARGIGRATAAQFAEAGATVVGADRDVEALDAVEELSLRLGGDVGDTDDAHAIIDDTLAALGRRYPLGRMGEPEDVAHAIVFLASPKAAYITGATLPVTGGTELGVPSLF